MSKPKKFEDVLDECLERLLVKNETVEQCLQSFPQYSDRLKPLLEMALAARRVSDIQPAPEFRERARQQFQSALQQTGRQKSRVSFNWGWQPGWAVAVAIVLVLSLAGGGTVYAAAGSMPDSPLYTVKIATEQVRLVLTFSDLGKAELNAKLADKRVGEIIYLAEADKPEKMAMLTQNMNNHLIEISSLVSAPEVVSQVATAPAAEKAIVAQEAAPQQLTVPTTRQLEAAAPAPTPTAPTVPAPPQAAAVQRASDIKSQEQAANVTPLAVGSEKKSKEANQKADQRAKLKTTVESQANNNITRLRAALETAPASAKPALQTALDRSETEYKKAIEALK